MRRLGLGGGGVGEGEGEGTESGHFWAVEVGVRLGYLRESRVESHLSLDLGFRHSIHVHLNFLEILFVIVLNGVPLDEFE